MARGLCASCLSHSATTPTRFGAVGSALASRLGTFFGFPLSPERLFGTLIGAPFASQPPHQSTHHHLPRRWYRTTRIPLVHFVYPQNTNSS